MISIIIPVYNCENYIEDLLVDIQKQSFIQYEVILIDDGSKDRSGKICDYFCKKDSRFKVIHIANGGVSNARNLGILKAKGKYIRFLDSDDRISEDSLKKMFEYIEYPEIDLIIGRFYSEREVWQSEVEGIYDKQSLYLDFSKYSFSFYYGVVWNKLYKREIIMNYNIRFDTEINMCEDALFNFEYFRYINKVYYIKDEIYSYFNRENSLVSKVTYEENELIEKKCIRVLVDFLEQEEIENEELKKNMMTYLAYRYHMVYCRICTSNTGKYFKGIKNEYKLYKCYLKDMKVKDFWERYQNYENFLVYKIIRELHHLKCDGGVFLFVRTKEYIRNHNKNAIMIFRKLVKNPTMRV